MAIATINQLHIDPAKVLVICPASLRLNWAKELDMWQCDPGRPEVILSSKDTPARKGPLIVSYNLASSESWSEYLGWFDWQMVIFDEAHYLKNPEAERTRRLLGDLKKTRGLVAHAKRVLLLTGTPIPNRPHEFFWPIRRLNPAIIDGMSYYAFLRHYMTGFDDVNGFRPTGAKNQAELHNRLRASGWMIRREKAAVLPQLPDKRYSMIVFPQDSSTAKIIEREQQFSAREIMEHGVPVGVSALPELRKEMGLAKVKDCLAWIKDQLDGGMEKMIAFAHHTEVVEALVDGLKDYMARGIYGKTSMAARQAAVDAFQEDPAARVLVGSFTPMGTGWTLTAAHDVVFVEGSWVPSDNEQAADRVHRIGQEADKVTIYFLVVEGSLDAHILGTAASKASDIGKVLDKK